MRSNVLLLAMGLFVANPALARSCKPRTSTLDAATTTPSAAPTTPSTTATGVASTVLSSATLIETGTTPTIPPDTTATTPVSQTTTTVDVATSTSVAETTTIAEAITTAPGAESTTTAAADMTTTAPEAETTTTAEVVTTASEAESTTAAPLATPTFALVGGSGAMNGAPLEGGDQDGTLMLFNPNPAFADIRTRTFVFNPNTGRVQDKDTGVLVCAYYGYSNFPSDPAYFSFCQNNNIGPDMYYDYLTCQIVSGKLACTAPKASCSSDGDGNVNCITETSTDLNNQFYWKSSPGTGDYLYISSGSPSGYTPLDILVQEE